MELAHSRAEICLFLLVTDLTVFSLMRSMDEENEECLQVQPELTSSSVACDDASSGAGHKSWLDEDRRCPCEE